MDKAIIILHRLLSVKASPTTLKRIANGMKIKVLPDDINTLMNSGWKQGKSTELSLSGGSKLPTLSIMTFNKVNCSLYHATFE